MSYLCSVKEKGQQPNPLTPAFCDKAKAPKGKGEATADSDDPFLPSSREGRKRYRGWPTRKQDVAAETSREEVGSNLSHDCFFPEAVLPYILKRVKSGGARGG